MRGESRVILFAMILAGCGSIWGALPLTRLNRVFPMGTRSGAAVEVTIEGADLDGVNQLLISRPGFAVEALGESRFRVTPPADAPLGPVDVRAVGPWGISNPRTFVVGALAEVNEAEPNSLASQPQALALDSVVNGTIAERADVDYYLATFEEGQQVVIECFAERIDSQLNGVLTLFSPSGQAIELSNEARGSDPRIDFKVPTSGAYKIRVHDLTYAGSSGHFYRLEVHRQPVVDFAFPPVVLTGTEEEVRLVGQNLPGAEPAAAVPSFASIARRLLAPAGEQAADLPADAFLTPRQAGLDAFSVRVDGGAPILVGVAREPVTAEVEPNDELKGTQAIAVPGEIAGRCDRPGDRDIYRFSAKAGVPIEIEGISEQAGFPADLVFVLRRITGTDAATGVPTVEELGEFDDGPPSVGGLSYITSSHDPTLVFSPPADGEYLLEVRDRFAESRGDERFVYRVRMHPPQPDFRLLVTPADLSQPSSLLVHAGGTLEATVYVLRKGGFAGPIELSAAGLPPGVTASPTTIGPGLNQGLLIFQATPEAAEANGAIEVFGSATIGEQAVKQKARSATIIWPAAGNAPRPARLTRSVPMAVRGSAPYLLTAVPAETTVGQGALVNLDLKLERRWSDFADKLAGIAPRYLPAQAEAGPVEIAAGQNQGTLPIYFKPETPPGTYTVAVQGTGQVPFTKTPMAQDAKKEPVAVEDPSPPIRITVVPRPVEVAPSTAEPTTKPGQPLALAVKVNRQNGYVGPIRLSLKLPPGLAGIQGTEVVLPADVQETILPIQVASDVPVGDKGGVTIRGLAHVGDQAIPVDARIVLKVVN